MSMCYCDSRMDGAAVCAERECKRQEPSPSNAPRCDWRQFYPEYLSAYYQELKRHPDRYAGEIARAVRLTDKLRRLFPAAEG